VTQRALGYFVSLDGFPSLDPNQDLRYPALATVDGGTIRSQAAQSYTQWVPLNAPDTALSLLPIGPSERPESRYRTSNLAAWEKGELHPAPLSRDAVEQLADVHVDLQP
jgi:acyl-homoserine lactone acylase PvdQ